MAQVVKKFIASNAIDGSKILLLNADWVRALTVGAAVQNVMRLNASDVIEFATLPQAATGTPTFARDLITKEYADSIINGLRWKQSVDAASTMNVSLAGSGALSIDGVAITNGLRVLLKDQTDSTQNGIYRATIGGGIWSLARTDDMDTGSDFPAATVAVEAGTANDNSIWICANDDAPVIGTAAISFVKYTTLADLVAGFGLSKTGNTLDVKTDGTTSYIDGSNQVAVKLNTAGGIVGSVTGLKINLETVNPSLEISTNMLRVKVGATTSGLTQDGNGLKVKTDSSADATTNINASGELIAAAERQETKTLIGADITNGYVDLANLAKPQSVQLVSSGVVQRPTLDYTVSTVGGVTRVTWTGDLTDPGKAQLNTGDVLFFAYRA